MSMGDVHPAQKPKTAVNYKMADMCSRCTYFERIAKFKCLKVEGVIKPDHWCRLFEERPGERNG